MTSMIPAKFGSGTASTPHHEKNGRSEVCPSFAQQDTMGLPLARLRGLAVDQPGSRTPNHSGRGRTQPT
jgi:hypothetical protein